MLDLAKTGRNPQAGDGGLSGFILLVWKTAKNTPSPPHSLAQSLEQQDHNEGFQFSLDRHLSTYGLRVTNPTGGTRILATMMYRLALIYFTSCRVFKSHSWKHCETCTWIPAPQFPNWGILDMFPKRPVLQFLGL